MSAPGTASRLGRGQRAVSAVAVLLGLLLAAYGAVGSYGTIKDLAWRKQLPLPELVPVGIDGGLFGVMLLEIVLTWTGQPLVWLRQLVRLLTIGTIAANAVAGWPDPIAVGLHIAAPVMLLAMLEAARAVLLRRIGIATGTARERIPSARWVLAPWRTWLLWRRMVLWQITAYHSALDMEMKLPGQVRDLLSHIRRSLSVVRRRGGSVRRARVGRVRPRRSGPRRPNRMSLVRPMSR